MRDNTLTVSASDRFRLIMPVAVLIVMLAGSFAASSITRRGQVAADRARFDSLSARLVEEIQRRLTASELAVRSARGAFLSQERLTRGEWEIFVGEVKAGSPDGLQSLAFIERVRRADVFRFLAEVRAEDDPGFNMREPRPDGDLYIIRYHHPGGEEVIGFDIGRMAERREAAEEAMRTGNIVLSQRTLFLGDESSHAGFLLLNPIYSTPVTPATPEEREAELRGWICATMRIDQMMVGISELTGGLLAFDIFDSARAGPDSFLYDSDSPEQSRVSGLPSAGEIAARRFSNHTPIDLPGRTWTVRTSSRGDLEAGTGEFLATLLLVTGSCVSVLAALLAWVLANSRRRALELAEDMTAGLREAEAESRTLAAIVSRTEHGVILTDPEGRVQWVNESFTRITGFSRAEVTGKRHVELLYGKGGDEAALASMDARLAARKGFTSEMVNYRKDGTAYWVHFEVQPFFDDEGTCIHFMGFYSDITDRKRSETELARKERQFRLVFETVPVGLSWALGDGEARRASLTVNDAHLAITGMQGGEVDKAGALLHATHPEDRDEFAQLDRKLEAGEFDTFTAPRRFVRPDGSIAHTMFTRRVIKDPDGGPDQEIVTAVDVTAQRLQAEELRTARDAAEQASVAKSQFLAMMSHEIRTPMNGVIGMTSLLLDSGLNPDQRELAETVRSSSDALLTIINDILDFSKIESGRMELESAPVDVASVIMQVVDLFTHPAAEKQLELLCDIGDDVPRLIEGDSTRLRQVLVNLTGNALKFTESGEVEISLRSGHKAGNRHEFTFAIRDTGIGIPDEAKDRLFQSFTQVDSSTARRFGGTGLGLAISRRLVGLMGGRMWVASEPGRGSTFYFSLIADALPDEEAAARESIRSRLRGKRMLIVDDNASSRRILASHATTWGMTATALSEPDEVTSAFGRGDSYDVALFDLQMPEGGVNLARRLRATSAQRDIPFILYSSVGELPANSDGSLFAATVSKPARPDMLAEALARAFGNTAGIDESASGIQPPAEQPRPAPADERILLAEDNPINQKVALRLLARAGYRADVAINGLEVLEALLKKRYDVILMDMQMPEMDGLETTRRIVASRPDPRDRPWIIALTANAMTSDRELCVAAGMDDFVSKPIKPDTLIAALTRARTRSIDPRASAA